MFSLTFMKEQKKILTILDEVHTFPVYVLKRDNSPHSFLWNMTGVSSYMLCDRRVHIKTL
jgi:hypothetical protein